ncbi:hypothetical protein IFM89_029817 [Coptis chinensis]|uniref:Phosphoribosylglycinamide synthetase ATP-grasp (A) domain-containing protein n=1 Tax=Coptis chinensis TaxID=261450 RepID=A0A835HSP8_9MAGN|nr:hypothetical protein IFM89_029817 [Coptis chinensis]
MLLLRTIAYMASVLWGLDLLVLSSAKCLEAGEIVGYKEGFTDKRYKNRGAANDRAQWITQMCKAMPNDLDVIRIRKHAQLLMVSDLRSCLGFSQTDQLDAKHVGRDGLAAGKGVVVAMTLEEAYEVVDSMLVEGIFGSAGCSVVIEEFLEGEEALFFALVDGKNAIPLESAQDHKCVGDGDTGPNTGGIGLMIEKIGAPKLIEYNVCFGDPECQVSHNPKLTYLIQVIVKVLEKVLMLELMPPYMQGNEPTLIWAWSRNFPGSKGNSFIFKIHHKLLAYAKVTHHEVVLGIVLPDVFSSPDHQT